ncbi:coiled-coil domain-containing protein 150 [Heteronotia binoei]|uniref:coiled-coil domain-containing protein 150 n=1 Tax=Heteronotia binoei TaxID=13085 RepID=UPI0029319966|nr:coiled-coil domain-containing protein 150 [Heteronotia binoei]
MARPIIAPVSVNATAPEAFEVLNQRMRVVEEQTSTLLKDMEALGANGYSVEFFPPKPAEHAQDHQSISPLCARVAFVGENDPLWKQCEKLVSRMCRLESIVQTLKLNVFRLQTEKELNPQHAANLERRLNAMQEEHLQELRVLQAEGRTLRQQLSDSQEEAEKARERTERLSAALEIATATKRDVAIAAEELRATKLKMGHSLQELREQLSKESGTRKSLEESHGVLLYRVQDMEQTVEKERKQVQLLQQDCNGLRQAVQTAHERLQEAEERAGQLEQEGARLRAELESRETAVFKLSEEEKAAQLSFSREHEENLKLRSEITALQEMAGKVQVLNEQLSQQCAELSETLRRVTVENARLISDHQAALKAEQDRINQKLQEQDLLLDAARASITGELQNLQKEKVELQREMEALRAEHADCKQRARDVAVATATQKEHLEATVTRLQNELEAALQERESLVMEKERLEEEMQRTIREMSHENNRLEAEVTGNQLQIGSLKERLATLEAENRKSAEREAALEHQLHDQQEVERALAKLTDDKNKLASEKGSLQMKVQQLEGELQPFAEARAENSRLHKLNVALETKYNQVNAELGSLKVSTQKMQAQLKQTQSALDCREEEYLLTIKSRDEALRENQEIKKLMSASEERGKRKLTALRRKLEEANGDNHRVTTLLENVVASHKKMEKAMEKAHTELGRKDSEISGLRRERTQSQQRIQKLEAELEQCHSQMAVESPPGAKTDQLRKVLEATKGDNKKLAENLEQTLQSKSFLQNKVADLQEELELKEAAYQKLVKCRDQLIEDAKMEAQLCAERLETLKKQFQVEREAVKKVAQKELAEMKAALEEARSKSTDVSRCNRELRVKVMELEEALVSHKERVKRQKVLITQYFSSKANNTRNAERIKEIEQELRQMEEMKEQYQKKNQEQSVSIKEFITELAKLQSEMQQLARNQEEVAMQNRHLESRLEVEQQERQQLEEQCKALEETVRCLKKCKEDTEKKLKEASIESEQITANLEEAHHWFKSKFDSLQRELAKHRQQRVSEDQGYKEEERPEKLPSQACLKRWETKQHLKFLARKYLG